jgi:ribonuclease Z
VSPEYIVPLGTSAAVPSGGRHFASIAYVAEKYVVLFDCGEGTQFRLIEAGIRTSRIRVIAISHLHGDHYLGLPGLLSTMVMQQRENPLALIAPAPLEGVLAALPGIGSERRPFEIDFRKIEAEFSSGRVYRHAAETSADTGGFSISAAALDHTVTAYGFRLQADDRPGNLDIEKAIALGVTDHDDYRALKSGKSVQATDGRIILPPDVVSPPVPGASFAYVSDSRPSTAATELASEVDLLYHEATFGEDERDRALATGHSTAKEAGEVAARASARCLVLGHFSARYPDAEVLAEEARAVFPQVESAKELERYYLRNPDPSS